MKINLDSYFDDGICLVKNFFDREEVARLLDGWKNITIRLDSPQDPLRRDGLMVYGDLGDPLGTLYKHPALVDLARRICGDDIALYLNRLLVKDKNFYDPVHVHQDFPYFNGNPKKFNVFIPLGAVGEENGGLFFFKGSHKYGAMGIRGTILPEEFPPMERFLPNIDCGDVILSDHLIWHGSVGRQKGTSERPMLQIIYQPADDGSFYSYNLLEPTLVHGQWRTRHFLPLGFGVKPT